MTVTVDSSFIKQYETEVHEAYQQRGSKTRGTMRLKTNVMGSSTTFQTVGTGAAAQKTRHGVIPVMNADHTPVEVTLADWYAADWSDKLDEAKQNISEKQVIVNAGAWALGRKIDSMAFTAARASLAAGRKVAEGSAGMTLPKVYSALELLYGADVPDDGDIYFFVGVHQWSELLAISQFSDADFIGAGDLPFMNGRQVKKWLNAYWCQTTQLPIASGTRYCLAWHRTAMALAEGGKITSDITWHGDHGSHFVSNAISAGAQRIDANGVVEIACDDDAAIS
jgi:hypothetical protein